MLSSSIGKVIRRTLFRQRSGSARSDGQLLERFVAEHDEGAFAELVRRHGPMVLRVCQRVLRHTQDAEDAFQATFIVLARKAGGVAQKDALANWLYGVAYRVAQKARVHASIRHARERAVGETHKGHARRPAQETTDVEVGWLLDEELVRLPEKYRAPMVLCYLQGKTNEEAAALLACPVGTVKIRLLRGREMLRGRLTRRGLVSAGSALATMLAPEAATAALPVRLMDRTAATGAQIAAGTLARDAASTPAVALADATIHGLNAAHARVWSLTVLAAMLLGTTLVGVVRDRPSPTADPRGAAGNSETEATKPLASIWKFSGGPASDLTVVAGRWSHIPGQPGAMTAMQVTVLLPTPIPSKPICVSLKLRGANDPDLNYVGTSCSWSDGKRTRPRQVWHNVIPFDWSGADYLQFYFVDHWSCTMVRHHGREEVHRMHQYDRRFPGDQIAVHLRNIAVEAIELRELRPAEIPPVLRSPASAVQNMQVGPYRAGAEDFR